MESSEANGLVAMALLPSDIEAMLSKMFREFGVDPRDIQLLISKFNERKVLTCASELYLPSSEKIFKDLLKIYDFLKKIEGALNSLCVVQPGEEDLEQQLAFATSSILFKCETEQDNRNIHDRIHYMECFLKSNLLFGNKLELKTGAQLNLQKCLSCDAESFIDTVKSLCREGTSEKDVLCSVTKYVPRFTHGMTQDPSSTSSSAIPCSTELRLDMCYFCKKKDTKLQLCSKCRFITYCSKECQIEDWKERHKHECNLK